MKKWQIIVACLAALLVMVITPLSIMAQGQGEADTAARWRSKGGLAIVAPRVAFVNHEMSLSVFLRYDQEPMAKVAVWAVARENVESLKRAAQTLREKGLANITEQDYQSSLEVTGTLLGRTDDNGKLNHTFTDRGNYVLVAIKAGYIPGFSGLAVREGLAITAPRKASPGEEVTITVHQRGTGNPVEQAGVWAVTRDNIQAIKERLQAVREANKGHLWDADWEALLDEHATPLGHTDANGQITHTFNSAGGYLLITAKKGCIPGYAVIAIVKPTSVPTDITK
jgi:hypothetical protein